MRGAELSGLKFRRSAQSVCMFRKKKARAGWAKARKESRRNCKSVWEKEKAGTDDANPAFIITERHDRPP